MKKNTERRICIIGAGPTGLVTARQCLNARLDNDNEKTAIMTTTTITIFEQRDQIGGLWTSENQQQQCGSVSNHSGCQQLLDPQFPSATGIYPGMRTNFPKQLMEFDGATFANDNAHHHPIDDNDGGPSFITREEVLHYWQRYAQIMGLLPPLSDGEGQHSVRLRLNRRVVGLSRVHEKTDGEGGESGEEWLVDTEDTAMNSDGDEKWSSNSLAFEEQRTPRCRESHRFDAIFVCTGYCNEPRMPAWASQYQRPALHSKFYAGVAGYEGATVAIVGMGPSGRDIGMQLAEVAKKVHLLHRNPSSENTSFGRLPPNCCEGAHPVGATEEALLLADGTQLNGLDRLIYCTGYKFSFAPFIGRRSQEDPHQLGQQQPTRKTKMDRGACRQPVELTFSENDSVIGPLFAHVAHTDYIDSLFFVGLLPSSPFVPSVVIPWQARLAISLMTRRLVLSAQEVADFDANKREEMRQSGTPSRYYHKFTRTSTMWAYVDYLYSLCKRCGGSDNAGVEMWGEAMMESSPYKPVTKAMFLHVTEQLARNIQHSKQFHYTVVDDEHLVVKSL